LLEVEGYVFEQIYQDKRLVAEAFCINDNQELKVEVHHIKKFDPLLLNEDNNRADNLVWVSNKVHQMLDAIQISHYHKISVNLD